MQTTSNDAIVETWGTLGQKQVTYKIVTYKIIQLTMALDYSTATAMVMCACSRLFLCFIQTIVYVETQTSSKHPTLMATL